MKAFYFAYGNQNFGIQKELGSDLTISLDTCEGAGVALIKSVNVKKFTNTIFFSITNNFNSNVTVRIEKKYSNNVTYEKLTIKGKKSKSKIIKLTDDEKSKINEIVVAILKEDNSSTAMASITVNASLN